MRHFFRTHLAPADVMTAADGFFAHLGLAITQTDRRARTYQGTVGAPEIIANVRLTAVPEGGHYTLVEAISDQMGESRLDRNIKRFFVQLKRTEDPRHALEAAY